MDKAWNLNSKVILDNYKFDALDEFFPSFQIKF